MCKHARTHPAGGGGGTSIMYAYWVCAARETPIFSPEFPFRSISFSQITKKNPFRSITILHFLAYFAVPETIIFKISLISTRSSPPTAGSARTQSVRQRRGLAAVPEIRIFTLKTDQARSGAPQFHAQNGSSSFRSPAISRSKRLKLVPEPHIFTLDQELVPEPLPIFHFAAAHTYQNLGWVPPPPPPRAHTNARHYAYTQTNHRGIQTIHVFLSFINNLEVI